MKKTDKILALEMRISALREQIKAEEDAFILKLVADGLGTTEIAKEAEITRDILKVKLSNLYKIQKVRNLHQLVCTLFWKKLTSKENLPGPPGLPGPPEKPLWSILTPRELEVATLIGKGLSIKQIAIHLTLAEHTIKAYTSNVLYKIKRSNRRDIALRYLRERYFTLRWNPKSPKPK